MSGGVDPRTLGQPPVNDLPGPALHLEAGESTAHSGVWKPDPPTVKRIRDRIAPEPDAWKRVIRGKIRLEGESLRRPPPGYPPDHQFTQDLVRKNIVACVGFRDALVTSPDFLDTFFEAGKAMDPLNRFLADAIGLLWGAGTLSLLPRRC